ncbi:hypothetical protein ACFS5N_16345 [Mucilaginibacter ximonensis]|uniref:Uncharacterized protein n=1 Tax=Mucilaginibacter ximonensis TaxID=538021 RepID=A0ABW5YGA3_9SPHI
MPKKFRKVWVIVQDGLIFTPYNAKEMRMYSDKEEADRLCELYNNAAQAVPGKWHEDHKPSHVYEVHGFYLIHEAYF